MSLLGKVICAAITLVAFNSHAEIKSSVSPEFQNGLHAQYLKYIADKMQMSLDIQPMPFARRIKQFEQGKLDMLVGLIKRKEGHQDFIYLEPGYEKLASSFFVLKENRHKLKNKEDLTDFIVGVTNGSEYFDEFERQQEITRVEVNSLKQKIGLLSKGRIGTFLHYRQSTMAKLLKNDLQDRIVLAEYQPKTHESHHFVITEKSSLFPFKNKLEKIIASGVKNGDFSKIRSDYYKAKQAKTLNEKAQSRA